MTMTALAQRDVIQRIIGVLPKLVTVSNDLRVGVIKGPVRRLATAMVAPLFSGSSSNFSSKVVSLHIPISGQKKAPLIRDYANERSLKDDRQPCQARSSLCSI